jgi:hypothetical protein
MSQKAAASKRRVATTEYDGIIWLKLLAEKNMRGVWNE